MDVCDVVVVTDVVVVVVVVSVLVVDMVVVDTGVGAEFGSDTVEGISPHAHKTPHSSPQTHKQAIHRFFFNIFSATFPLIQCILHLYYTVSGEGSKEKFLVSRFAPLLRAAFQQQGVADAGDALSLLRRGRGHQRPRRTEQQVSQFSARKHRQQMRAQH